MNEELVNIAQELSNLEDNLDAFCLYLYDFKIIFQINLELSQPYQVGRSIFESREE